MENVCRTIIGIQNSENLCYLNSVLQLLFNIDPLNRFIMKTKSYNKGFVDIYKSMLELSEYNELQKTEIDNCSVLEPEPLKENLENIFNIYKENRQQDAHETLLNILTIFQESLKNNNFLKSVSFPSNFVFQIPMEKLRHYAQQCWENDLKKDNYSIISNIFKGQIKQKITCQECLTEFNKFECFNDISLPLPDYEMDNLNIYDCLENFCNTEYMISENMYHCEICNKETEAVKNISFWRLPRYIIIHFNRFKISYDNILSKNDTKVSFPTNDLLLDDSLSTYKYSLTGLIKHHGDSIQFGHYTSYIFNKDLNMWLHIDDDTIEQKKLCDDPYILIYEQDLSLPS